MTPASFKAPVVSNVVQVPVPWSHSKYISPDSAQTPPPTTVIAPPMVKLPLALIPGSDAGVGIVTPVILVAI